MLDIDPVPPMLFGSHPNPAEAVQGDRTPGAATIVARVIVSGVARKHHRPVF